MCQVLRLAAPRRCYFGMIPFSGKSFAIIAVRKPMMPAVPTRTHFAPLACSNTACISSTLRCVSSSCSVRYLMLVSRMATRSPISGLIASTLQDVGDAAKEHARRDDHRHFLGAAGQRVCRPLIAERGPDHLVAGHRLKEPDRQRVATDARRRQRMA